MSSLRSWHLVKQYQTRSSVLQYICPLTNMFHFIKNTILGSRFFQTTGSADVRSKDKRSVPRKKPLSFDSKQKQEKDALLTSQRNQRPEIIMQDETATIKKYSYTKDHGEVNIKNEDFAVVSDIDGDFQNGRKNTRYQRQTNIYHVKFQEHQDHFQVRKSPLKDPAQMKSSIFPQSQGKEKVLIERERSAKKVKRVGYKCVICNKDLSIEDSFQLACSHRCHNGCGDQMKWRMRYNCDACEVKHDFSRCSVGLHLRKKRRKE